MTKERLDKIREEIEYNLKTVREISCGNSDDFYSGEDYRETIQQISLFALDLIKEVERLSPMADGIH